MKTKQRTYMIIVVFIISLVLSGCGIEGKVRFIKVSLPETVLYLQASNDVWINDMVNERHYQIDNFVVDMEDTKLEQTTFSDGYEINVEFSTFYLGRYYHLRLYQKEEQYILETFCFTSAQSAPLTYSKQTYYICPNEFASKLLSLRKNFEEKEKN